MKRRILGIVLCLSMVLSLMPFSAAAVEHTSDQCPALAFDDLDVSCWYHEGVDYVIEHGIMIGVGNGLFAPDDVMERAMLVTTLWRMEGEPVVEGEYPFLDVAEGAYYTEAIRWAADAGIIKGVSETKFAPEEPLERQQAAVILYRYAGYKGWHTEGDDAVLSAFVDADMISQYAQEAMAWACDKGLIIGVGNHLLTPVDGITRAQSATILYRLGSLESQEEGDIAILYTNDIHTYIDGPLSYDVIAALKEDLREQYEYVLLVDAGDHIQGTAYGSMDKGKTIISLMNSAGYDFATLGNHDFDYNMVGCMNVISWAEYPYVSCNFYHEDNGVRGDTVLEPYVTFELGDEVVAVVGITTPESFTKTTPAYFQDEEGNYIYGISGGDDDSILYADVQAAIDAAEAEGATKVIALGHLGDDLSSGPWTSEETIANVSGLDAFIDGHSHSTVEGELVADKDGNDVLLTQTGEYFNRIGLMVIDGDSGEITTDFIECEEVTDPETGDVVDYKLSSELYQGEILCSDPETAAIKDAWVEEIDEQLGTVIGTAAITLDNYQDGQRLVRKQETNTGDFAADALYYLFDSMELDVDVALMNGGGVRNKAITGDITYKTCKNIHTFGNVACLQTVTGQQILDALEWASRSVGTQDENGSFMQVSGMTYKVNGEIPDTTQQDEYGVWTGGPTGEYRVYDVMVYNKETQAYEPLDLEAKYNLAGYNYTLRDLGDGFGMFEGAVNVADYVMEDYMVLATYVQAFENGVVDATNSPLLAKYPGMLLDYGTVYGSGRITIEASR